MGQFIADPLTIEQKGQQIISLADAFTANMNKMDATINELVSLDYVSPEAKVLGKEIKDYRPQLENIRNVMAAYGNFGRQTVTVVINNQQELSADVRARV